MKWSEVLQFSVAAVLLLGLQAPAFGRLVMRLATVLALAIGASLVAADVEADDPTPPNLLAEFVIAADIAFPGSDTLRPGRPAIAFDGTNYLVVSCADAISPTGMFGALVSQDSIVLDLFHIDSADCSAQSAVGFDGTNYLVVFADFGQIFGYRITPDGTILDGPGGFPIGSTSGNPSIAFNGTDYLVVWNKFISGNHELFGTRVNPDGQVLDTPPIEIFLGPGEQVSPAVASDGNDFLVVWRDTPTGSGPAPTTDITGARVDSDGSVLDPGGIPISTAPELQGMPSITFAAENYFVVWVDRRNAASPFILDIYGSRITTAGVVLDGMPGAEGIPINTFQGSTSLKVDPNVGFDGANYFVVWELSGFSDPAGLYAARISMDGSLIDGPPDTAPGQLISQTPCDVCQLVHPTIHSEARTSLIAWTNNAGGIGTFKDIVGAILISEGPDAKTLVENLIAFIADEGFQPGVENPLLHELLAALGKIEDDNPRNDQAAARILEAFIHTVEAIRGHNISDEQADDLIALAEEAIALL